MASPWTISQNFGSDVPVDQIGSGVTITDVSQVSQQMDTCTIVSMGPNEVFAFKDWLIIKLNGTIMFQGIVRKPRPLLMPNNEIVTYEVLGPWYYFSVLVFQSIIYSWLGSASAVSACPLIFPGSTGRSFTVGPSAAPVTFNECFNIVNTTHVWMNVSDLPLAPGQSPLEPVSWQLNNAVQWCIARFGGSPNIQIAASGSLGGLQDYDSLFPPYEEVRDITCAEVIAKQLRWAPDSVTWFDYSTSPPTFHVARRSSLPSVTVPISAIADSDRLVITPRYDLLVPKVVIRYERTITDNGNPFVTIINDAYPASASGVGTTDEFNAMRVTVDLIGQSSHTEQVTINSLPLPPSGSVGGGAAQTTAQQFWLARQGFLGDIPASAWTVDTIARTPTVTGESDQGYGNWIVKGQVPAWLDIGAQQIRIDSQYHVVQTQNRSAYQDAKLSDEVVATTLNTHGVDQTYYYRFIDQFAEPEPSGLAQQMYNALSVLHYEGEIEVVDPEVGTNLQVGMVLNITGGDTAWATMKALIQEVKLSPETGKTVVRFGVPGHLSVPEMVTLLRVQRTRLPWFNWSLKFGTVPSLLNDTLGTYVHSTKAGANGGESYQRFLVSTDIGHSDPVQALLMDASGAAGKPHFKMYGSATADGTVTVDIPDASGHTIKLRQMIVCDPGTGATGNVIVLASETF